MTIEEKLKEAIGEARVKQVDKELMELARKPEPNITCPRCRHRHPASRTCAEAKRLADEAAALRLSTAEETDDETEKCPECGQLIFGGRHRTCFGRSDSRTSKTRVRRPTLDQRALFLGIMLGMAKEYGFTLKDLVSDIRCLWRLVK